MSDLNHDLHARAVKAAQKAEYERIDRIARDEGALESWWWSGKRMQQRDAEIASCRLCKVIEHPEWDGKMKGSKP